MFKLLLFGLAFGSAEALLAEQQESVLALHNQYRAAVANGQVTGANGATLPTAADMKALVYNTDLENNADRIVVACNWNTSSTGQNLYASAGYGTATDDTIKNAVAAWNSEATNLSTDDIPQYKANSADTNFTQLIWANTSEIGCAITFCGSLSGFEGAQWTYFVCAYSAPGNVLNQPIYTSGTTASLCVDGVVNGSLCVKTGSTTTSSISTSSVSTSSSSITASSTTVTSTSTTASFTATSTNPSISTSTSTATSTDPRSSTRGCRTRPYQY
ncbi:unnamed protein product [Bursaphelenchus okinawaensis]|uniref:SCP domain-containing protein n=1 Tax=Bursaphelenchus okinawaensis TaxID=465554 RepID=A0A811L8H9_9BILA|nr:unnamed protein product [Bursaphelenchus okinawaensis]CAG9119174.1 unnamed protein product [Bursaphelenchus okinawaensis]